MITTKPPADMKKSKLPETVKELSRELVLLRFVYAFTLEKHKGPSFPEAVEYFASKGLGDSDLVSKCQDMLNDQGALDDKWHTENGRTRRVFFIPSPVVSFAKTLFESVKD